MIWNFFRQPGKEDDLVPYTPYEPRHLDMMLEELQTDCIDTRVVHADDDADGQRRELELTWDWMESGRVGSVALGMAKARHLDVLPEGHPVSGVLIPYNAVARGPLTEEEQVRLEGWRALAESFGLSCPGPGHREVSLCASLRLGSADGS